MLRMSQNQIGKPSGIRVPDEHARSHLASTVMHMSDLPAQRLRERDYGVLEVLLRDAKLGACHRLPAIELVGAAS